MMQCRTSLTLSFCLFVLLLDMAGCLRVEKRRLPEKQYFVLDVLRSAANAPSPSRSVLKIRTIQVSPQYRGKGFVYRNGHFAYESDFYNEFFISPDSMFTEEVHQWLAASRLFQHVVKFSSYMEPTYILEGTVTALYGDYRERTEPKAVLEMQFFLLEDAIPGAEPVFQGLYHRDVSLDGGSAEVLVEGWNNALRQILTEFEKDLRERGFAQGEN
jgi:uncharacterized lipoprotein YmbA